MIKKLITGIICIALIFSNTTFIMASGDTYEPNNSIATAASVPLQFMPIKSAIYQQYDQDWFKTQYYSNGYASFALDSPAGQDYCLIIHYKDPQGDLERVAVVNNAGVGGTDTIKIPVTKNYEYYFFVYSPSYGFSTEQYELKQTNFSNSLDAAYENNNENHLAFDVDIYSNVNASISSPNDMDWYKFTANNSGPMKLQLISPSNKNYDMHVLDRATGTTLGSSFLGAGKTDYVNFNAVAGHEYTVLIYGANYDYMSNVPYTLFVGN
ncbi:hypothetical protein HZI73_02870 [Vallitalea pronyensis]|uniref:Uncharacterized protein n=1 Tax=Vallitalea pronyensis TaxID=1348613 RepID=A0A8J8MGM4_9FIRM|nr:hypothetical protein [Vallitalea pronyensis]QUI21290.1 hypothetical protein HZI73_02870 [Vallitalea pronyensis]